MEVVYFFYEPGTIRIPFFDYDQSLFHMFVTIGGGVWDAVRKEFVFKRNGDTARFKRIISYIPNVHVLENDPNPVRVFGLRGRQWQGLPEACPAKKGAEDTVRSSKKAECPVPVPLPPLESDKFPKYWEIKLENEMRAVKYSRKTRHNYMYYNRFLCHNLQKLPEEIQSVRHPFAGRGYGHPLHSGASRPRFNSYH